MKDKNWVVLGNTIMITGGYDKSDRTLVKEYILYNYTSGSVIDSGDMNHGHSAHGMC